MQKTVFLFLLAVSILSCNRPFGAIDGLDYEIPDDESTTEERQLINEIKADIIQTSVSFGIKLDLDKLPIIVTSRQDIVTSEGNTGFNGLCFWDQNKKGKAILLNKAPFRYDLYKAESLKKAELAPQTFHTLLHEIGHCYFGREHESQILQRDGKQITIHQTNESYNLPFVTTSVMDNTAGSMIPYSLKKYYVAEIIGYFRASSLDEVAHFINAEMTDRPE
ncbi:MAG: hypothetical protein IPM97_05225 [Bdellovibrionaceae bacterium]|nr:hypothetical protein [Pseudobdellovibrionaceae bacterium]